MDIQIVYFNRLHSEAVMPQRSDKENTGFDLTLVRIVSREMLTKTTERIVYGTGIAVMPPSTHYFDMIPRSSFSKTGLVLGNSFGVIDTNYRGELMTSVLKFDPDLPDLTLPGKYFQLLLRRKIDAVFLHGDLTETNRGNLGFGDYTRLVEGEEN